MHKTAITFLSIISLSLACSDDPVSSCIDICEEAQARDCTTIDNCAADCTQGNNLASKANCEDERDAYLSCASSVDTCTIDANCASQEQAFGACVVPYCLANPGDSDCQ